jgi:hypothetical protein
MDGVRVANLPEPEEEDDVQRAWIQKWQGTGCNALPISTTP